MPVQQPQLKSFTHPHGLRLSVLLVRARNGIGKRINVIAFRSSTSAMVALIVAFADDSNSFLGTCLLYRASIVETESWESYLFHFGRKIINNSVKL